MITKVYHAVKIIKDYRPAVSLLSSPSAEL